MNNTNASIIVIGAGSCGTAFSIRVAKNGFGVVLWGRDPKHIAFLQNKRCNTRFLPNIPLPDSIYLESDLAKAMSFSRNVLIAVPSYAFVEVLQKIKPLIRRDTRVAWATKGLEARTGRLLKDVAYEILGKNVPLAVISGPTLAKEMAEGLPTAVSLASTDENFSKDLQNLLHYRDTFQIYKNSDFTGIQLCGVLKNIIAIGAGISDGIGLGTNARSILISNGLNEMLCFGVTLGARPTTFTSIAGLGDLVLSCTNNQSRNRRFGVMLTQEINVQVAQKRIGQLVEGYFNAKKVHELAHNLGVKMPISNEVYRVLFCGKNVREAAIAFFEQTYEENNIRSDDKIENLNSESFSSDY